MNSQIQWFPGHMQKARRQIEERLKSVKIDVVLEILDARIPYSSQNPLIKQIVGQRNRLVLLNKTDLADPAVTKQWLEEFEHQGLAAMAIDALSTATKAQILAKCRELTKEKMDRERAKGLRPRPIRAMIMGIPNAGKSTLINTLAKRKAARVENRPGVTVAQQLIKIGNDLEIFDTPGVLWPKFESPHVGYALALTGAIKDTILATDDVAIHGLNYMMKQYPHVLKERFGIDAAAVKIDETDPVLLLTEIGKNRNYIMQGGEVDYDRVCDMLIKEMRDLKLGRLSFETPDSIKEINEDNGN